MEVELATCIESVEADSERLASTGSGHRRPEEGGGVEVGGEEPELQVGYESEVERSLVVHATVR